MSEVGKSVGGKEKLAPNQLAVADTSLDVVPVVVIRKSHNISSMFVVIFVGELGYIVCPRETVISGQWTKLLSWLILQHFRK
jgi:hypothetical protein